MLWVWVHSSTLILNAENCKNNICGDVCRHNLQIHSIMFFSRWKLVQIIKLVILLNSFGFCSYCLVGVKWTRLSKSGASCYVKAYIFQLVVSLFFHSVFCSNVPWRQIYLVSSALFTSSHYKKVSDYLTFPVTAGFSESCSFLDLWCVLNSPSAFVRNTEIVLSLALIQHKKHTFTMEYCVHFF